MNKYSEMELALVTLGSVCRVTKEVYPSVPMCCPVASEAE